MRDTFLTLFSQLQRGQVPNLPDNAVSNATVNRFRGLALTVMGAVALIILAYAGYKFVTSQGNPDETAKAQKTIIFTIVGLVVGVLTVAIISFVVNNL